MKWLLMLLFPSLVLAEPLLVREASYQLQEGRPSCSVLKFRERERAKALREADYLFRRSRSEFQDDVLHLNFLVSNKYFLDQSVWRDFTALVTVTVEVSDSLEIKLSQVGLGKTFLSVQGPGFVWKSYGSQLPDDVSYEYNPYSKELIIRYPVYQSVFCDEEMRMPEVEWFDN